MPKDRRLFGQRVTIGGMPVRAPDGQREPRRVRLPPEQHLGVGDKLPTAAENKIGGRDRVGRIAPAQGVLIHPGRPVGERGRQQHQPASRPQRTAQGRQGGHIKPAPGIEKGVHHFPPQQRLQGARRHAGGRNRLGAHPQAIAGEPLPQRLRLLQRPGLVAAEHQQATDPLPRHLRGEVKQRVHHQGRLQRAAEGIALRRVAAVETAFEPGVALFRGAVGKAVRYHPPLALLLQTVVADGLGGV